MKSGEVGLRNRIIAYDIYAMPPLFKQCDLSNNGPQGIDNWRGETSVKIEVSPVLRGSVFPAAMRQITSRASSVFGFANVPVLSFEDLFGGKICAALDRQHPRDLYDVFWLLEQGGIEERLKNASWST